MKQPQYVGTIWPVEVLDTVQLSRPVCEKNPGIDKVAVVEAIDGRTIEIRVYEGGKPSGTHVALTVGSIKLVHRGVREGNLLITPRSFEASDGGHCYLRAVRRHPTDGNLIEIDRIPPRVSPDELARLGVWATKGR